MFCLAVVTPLHFHIIFFRSVHSTCKWNMIPGQCMLAYSPWTAHVDDWTKVVTVLSWQRDELVTALTGPSICITGGKFFVINRPFIITVRLYKTVFWLNYVTDRREDSMDRIFGDLEEMENVWLREAQPYCKHWRKVRLIQYDQNLWSGKKIIRNLADPAFKPRVCHLYFVFVVWLGIITVSSILWQYCNYRFKLDCILVCQP